MKSAEIIDGKSRLVGGGNPVIYYYTIAVKNVVAKMVHEESSVCNRDTGIQEEWKNTDVNATVLHKSMVA